MGSWLVNSAHVSNARSRKMTPKKAVTSHEKMLPIVAIMGCSSYRLEDVQAAERDVLHRRAGIVLRVKAEVAGQLGLRRRRVGHFESVEKQDRKSTRLNSSH